MEGYFQEQQRPSLQGKKWNALFTFISLCVLCLAICWLVKLPHSGVAVAVMGLAAAAMSLHTEQAHWQKALWLAGIGFLLTVELRAIRHDSNESHAQYLADRKNQDDDFENILKRQNQQISATAEGFADTEQRIAALLEKAERITSLSQENLLTVTAQDSFLCIYPDFTGPGPEGEWKFHNYGKHTLQDVRVTLYRVATGHYEPGYSFAGIVGESNVIDLGNIAGQTGGRFPLERRIFTPMLRPDGTDQYHVMIRSQSFIVNEEITIRPSKTIGSFAFHFTTWRAIEAKNRKRSDKLVGPNWIHIIKQTNWIEPSNQPHTP